MDHQIVSQKSFPIIGIGLPLKELSSLQAFFDNMPADIPEMAFVIIHHIPNYNMGSNDMDNNAVHAIDINNNSNSNSNSNKNNNDNNNNTGDSRKSSNKIILALLMNYNRFKTYEINDNMVVEPFGVYVAPVGSEVIISKGILYISDVKDTRKYNMPVNYFFRSLAVDKKESSVGIVFAGTGTDGSLGQDAIKQEGGMVMAQDPDSVEFKNIFYNSIILNEQIDFLLPPEDMPATLIAYINYSFGKGVMTDNFLYSSSDEAIQKILSLLYALTRHDFSGYKKNTLLRRIKRRMFINQTNSIEEYLEYLHRHTPELRALFWDISVGVTRFFRDPAAFKALQEKVIPRLFTGKSIDDGVRIWVPACSTGEEAYSIAILLREYMSEQKQPVKVQIFATDINSRAVEQARAGIYPAAIAADITPDRLNNYFIPEKNAEYYYIHKDIREMLVFAEQNVSSDPPFSNLDLISCRNLLIYMSGVLQQKVLNLFYYSLNQNGYLFLGTSETTGNLVDLYAQVDRKYKIYQSKRNVAINHSKLISFSQSAFQKPVQNTGNPNNKKRTGIRQAIEHYLLQRYTPACVVINKYGQIVYIHGHTGKFLELAPGEAKLSIINMARDGIKVELANAIRKAAMLKEAVECRGLRIREKGKTTVVNMIVSPILESEPDSFSGLLEDNPAVFRDMLYVIFQEGYFFEDDMIKHDYRQGVQSMRDQHIAAMERELKNKEQYVKTVIEELEASHEEVQASNEEFQSANEELETSKEDLQSLNEELTTVNSELQKKIDELSWANNDMSNMLAGTGMGTVFVDHQLLIKRFNPSATRVINLIKKDKGRPVNHIASNLISYNNLAEDVQEVLDTLIMKETEVQAKTGEWFLMRIIPYRSVENVIEGAVITFIDITEKKLMEESQKCLDIILHNANDAIIMHDLKGFIMLWNPAAQIIYGYSETEALSMNIADLSPVKGKEFVFEIMEKMFADKKVEALLIHRLTKEGETIKVWSAAALLLNKEGEARAVVITERIAN